MFSINPNQQPVQYVIEQKSSGCFGCIGKAVVFGFVGILAIALVAAIFNLGKHSDADRNQLNRETPSRAQKAKSNASEHSRDAAVETSNTEPHCLETWQLKNRFDNARDALISSSCGWLSEPGYCEHAKRQPWNQEWQRMVAENQRNCAAAQANQNLANGSPQADSLGTQRRETEQPAVNDGNESGDAADAQSHEQKLADLKRRYAAIELQRESKIYRIQALKNLGVMSGEPVPQNLLDDLRQIEATEAGLAAQISEEERILGIAR